ncbi:MAG: mediator of RNA polymerase II transcription subunit 13 [Pycnora praestabilis]|nr:MAG: mediator of RNA polymerase II transcription subunit 13 [Pycnora praestabilis]
MPGRELSAISAEDQNIVIYLVNPYTHPSALVDLCAAFLSLCHAYAHSPDFQVSKNCEVVLQIIPIGFIASAASIIIPTQADYTKLALEVYERCAPGHQDTLPRSSPTQYTPSVALAQTPPKSIDFKLTSEPSPSLLQENSCLHIAYSQSLDDRWISAAWTDNLGNCQTSASYCLGTKHSSLRPFVEIAQEIWETTMEIIQARRVTWRLLFAKSGVMNHEEIDTWATLANQPSVVSIVLTLLTTSPTSSLTLHVTMPTLSSATFNPQAGSYTTPVSTPQPSTLSPDQFGNAASTPSNTNTNNTNAGTPNADVSTLEVDPDASLVDVTDETWGAILSHRMQNTHSVLEYQPALASGYLIKRTGSREEDPPITFAVNLIYTTPLVPPPGHGQGPPGQRSAVMGSGMNAGNHALLKEVLGLYRGLGNLARAKGVVDRFKGIEPWHVAASRKAAAVLGWLM